MLEEPVGGIAERSRQRRTRQHQDEQQDHADHRPRERQIDSAHRRFSDELADEQGGDRGQHADTSLGAYAERACRSPCVFASRNLVALQNDRERGWVRSIAWWLCRRMHSRLTMAACVIGITSGCSCL